MPHCGTPVQFNTVIDFPLQATRAGIKTLAGPEGGCDACMCLKCHETAEGVKRICREHAVHTH